MVWVFSRQGNTKTFSTKLKDIPIVQGRLYDLFHSLGSRIGLVVEDTILKEKEVGRQRDTHTEKERKGHFLGNKHYQLLHWRQEALLPSRPWATVTGAVFTSRRRRIMSFEPWGPVTSS